MAVFKQSEDFLPLSGKIGGQSLANTRGPGTIRTITQTNTAGTILQRSQRFTTYYFAAKYMALHPQLKADWSAASLDYFYIANDSSLTQRTGYGTFLYINQNRFLIGLPLLLEPPIYTPVITPRMATNIDNNNKLLITTPDRDLNQTYAIFANMAIGLGATMKPGLGYFCGTISQTELDNGVNILPIISARFPGTFGKVNIGFYLSAIAADNGNRDQFPEMNNQITLVPEKLISIDILSYYNFNGNANDFFNINNAIYTGTTFNDFGIIDKAAVFNGSSSSYINLGTHESLNFSTGTKVGPFTLILWFRTSISQITSLIEKKRNLYVVPYRQYTIFLNPTNLTWQLNTKGISAYAKRVTSTIFSNDEWHFVATTYNGNLTPRLFIDGSEILNPVENQNFSYVPSESYPLTLGRRYDNPRRYYNGLISELAIINEELNPATIEIIRQANLNGKTILDINQ